MVPADGVEGPGLPDPIGGRDEEFQRALGVAQPHAVRIMPGQQVRQVDVAARLEQRIIHVIREFQGTSEVGHRGIEQPSRTCARAR